MLPVVSVSRDAPAIGLPWRRGAGAGGVEGAAFVSHTMFVSHTVFAFDRWRDLPAIGRDAERAARLWARQPGALWLAQWIAPGRKLIGDLSVWRGEGDLHAFLDLPEHHALVATWQGRMHGTHHHWTVDAPVERESVWREAMRLVRVD